MALSEGNDYTNTLPYFLTHGTRGKEICFVVYRGETKCVIYIDDHDEFIQTIPHELWDAKVVNHWYDLVTITECCDKGEVKRIGAIYAHYVEVTR